MLARLLYIGLAVVALAGLWVAFAPSGPERGPTPVAAPGAGVVTPASPTPASTAASTGAPAPSSSPVAPVPATTAAGASPAPQSQVVDFAIKRGKLVSGPSVVKATEGDTLTLNFTTDAPGELHLHGYDLHLAIKPGAPATLRFVARLTGRFGFELHGSHAGHDDLGAVEVYPR